MTSRLVRGMLGGMPVKVRARPGEPAPVLMKRFKKACDNEKLRDQMKRSATYEKPSDKRRRKKNSRSRRAAAAGK
jgi:ribosomal protein S21